MLSPDERERAVDLLEEAEGTRQPIEPLSVTFPKLEIEDAYEIQRANMQRRFARGAQIRGHKVGLTAIAMQQMMGVNEPDYGHLLDDMFVLEGHDIPAADLVQPRVEPEVAFVLSRPLAGPGCTVADVLRATAFVLPSLEIIDSRIRDWRITITDTIADNASSARVVLGGSPVDIASLDPRLVGCVLRKNGEVIDTGVSGAVYNNPVSAVAWLVNMLGRFGVTLEEGQVVLPGSCTKAYDVAAGDSIRADFDGLGWVAVNFT